ncbi:antibiotic biosynthesis monooxygenase [Flavisolibacter sp. BT320]|nr:antibiotic biosynthesis monooxygenase [Flavisolibacter longurius]
MIIRVVKMTFKEEEIFAFNKLFDERKSLIRNFPGCTHLELWQDKQHPQVFFTYSWWQSEDDLNRYRESHFFDDIWRLTKQKFAARPEAWTLDRLHEL